VTHDEALKLQWGSSFEGLKHGDIAGISEASGKTNRAQGFLEGYEQGVRDSAKLLPSIRRLICKCQADVCPRVVAIQDNLLILLDAKKKG
jgi:hypothetical protein